MRKSFVWGTVKIVIPLKGATLRGYGNPSYALTTPVHTRVAFFLQRAFRMSLNPVPLS